MSFRKNRAVNNPSITRQPRNRKIRPKFPSQLMPVGVQDICYEICGYDMNTMCGGGCEEGNMIWCNCCDGAPYPGTNSGVSCDGDDDSQVLQDIIDINNLPQTVDEMISLGRTVWENDRLVQLDLACYPPGTFPQCYAPPESPYLTQLPESIGNLTELRKILLQGNQLADLPSGFGNLVSLEEAIIYHNPWGGLDGLMNDDCFQNLTNLRILQMQYSGDNPDMTLIELPESICNCSSLETLLLYGGDHTGYPEEPDGGVDGPWYRDGLWFFPECLGQLTNLKMLDVAGNQIETIDFDICNMTSLERFRFSFCNITNMPDCVSNLFESNGGNLWDFTCMRNQLWCDIEVPQWAYDSSEVSNWDIDSQRCY